MHPASSGHREHAGSFLAGYRRDHTNPDRSDSPAPTCWFEAVFDLSPNSSLYTPSLHTAYILLAELPEFAGFAEEQN